MEAGISALSGRVLTPPPPPAPLRFLPASPCPPPPQSDQRGCRVSEHGSQPPPLPSPSPLPVNSGCASELRSRRSRSQTHSSGSLVFGAHSVSGFVLTAEPDVVPPSRCLQSRGRNGHQSQTRTGQCKRARKQGPGVLREQSRQVWKGGRGPRRRRRQLLLRARKTRVLCPTPKGGVVVMPPLLAFPACPGLCPCALIVRPRKPSVGAA